MNWSHSIYSLAHLQYLSILGFKHIKINNKLYIENTKVRISEEAWHKLDVVCVVCSFWCVVTVDV